MSTKWDTRLNRIEEQLQNKTVPKWARGPFLQWLEPGQEVDEKAFDAIRGKLMDNFGTTEGAEFYTFSWQSEGSEMKPSSIDALLKG